MTFPGTGVRYRIRRFVGLLATPLVPADYLDLINPLRPGAELRGRIVGRRQETADAVTLEIRPGAAWRGHLPGQHVRISVDVNGVRQHRTYSLTSVPGGPTITITPQRVPGGLVSTHLVEQARVGDLIGLAPAEGDFRVPEVPPARILLVTAGSGITPVLGMLRAGLSEATEVILVHSSPTPAAMIAGEEVRGIAAAGRLRLIEWHSATQGRLTPSALAGLVGDWAERDTWACGPTGLLDNLAAFWAEHELTDRLHTERFAPPPRPAAGAGGVLRFERSQREVDAAGDQTLLEAGEQAGILMPAGCRMGICHRCVLPLRSGSVRDLRTGELHTAEEGDTLTIQTCISAAAGACHLDH